MYDMSKWDAKFQKLAEVYRSLGADVEYRRAEPASPAEIAGLEKTLGQSLPPSLREFLATFSKDLHFSFRFPDDNMPEDLYDLVWYNKLGFTDVPNGDIVALDPADPKEDKCVVYLSHDDGEGHGWILAPTFGDFIERLIDIGDLRLEEWELLTYIKTNDGTGLDPNCEAADKFRQYIGLDWRLLLH